MEWMLKNHPYDIDPKLLCEHIEKIKHVGLGDDMESVWDAVIKNEVWPKLNNVESLYGIGNEVFKKIAPKYMDLILMDSDMIYHIIRKEYDIDVKDSPEDVLDDAKVRIIRDKTCWLENDIHNNPENYSYRELYEYMIDMDTRLSDSNVWDAMLSKYEKPDSILDIGYPKVRFIIIKELPIDMMSKLMDIPFYRTIIINGIKDPEFDYVDPKVTVIDLTWNTQKEML